MECRSLTAGSLLMQCAGDDFCPGKTIALLRYNPASY